MPSSEIIFSETRKYLCENIPDNHFDSFVTDAPYGFGDPPDIVEVMKDWIEKGFHEVKNSGGFMGKEWDKFVPQPLLWKEVIRTLKPGGHLICACGTRTVDWMISSLRFAGFEIRDIIAWHYGQGFPKSKDISKAIDDFFGAERKVVGKSKNNNDIRGNASNGKGISGRNKSKEPIDLDITEPSTQEAKEWEGWGTALKPATELFILARKPLSEKTLAENVLKWGTGAINIAESRIDHNGRKSPLGSDGVVHRTNKNTFGKHKQTDGFDTSIGRWPANVVLSHHPDCECMGTKKIKAITGGISTGGMGKKGKYNKFSNTKSGQNAGGLGDENGQEAIEDWKCVDGCPLKEMDEQSGTLTSGKMRGFYKGFGNGNIYSQGGQSLRIYEGDTGGASRFFYCAKPSASERNRGLELLGFKKQIGHNRFDKCKNCGGYILQNQDRPSSCKCENPEREDNVLAGNYHPTVKPVSLMRYFVKMVTPKKGKVCDSFNGSGTTGIACKLEGFDYVGIEEQEDMCIMSRYRIQAWEDENGMPANSLFGNSSNP